MHHTWQPSHIPRDCAAKISGVPLSRSRARVRPTLRAMEYRAERWWDGGSAAGQRDAAAHMRREFIARCACVRSRDLTFVVYAIMER